MNPPRHGRARVIWGSSAGEWPGERPFSDWGQWGYGHLDLRVFADNDEYWVDIEGTAHRLEDMTPGYRVNVLAWLDANAAYFHAMTIRKHLIEVYAELLDGRVDPLALRRLHHILASGPEQWLAATAIVQALKDAVGERGTSANQPRTVHPRRPPLGGPVPGVERLIITTENSRYDLDLRGGRVRRVPSTGARMRADSQWVPVRDVRPVEVGAPMAMRLDVRGDGVPTVRLTSPVIGVTTA